MNVQSAREELSRMEFNCMSLHRDADGLASGVLLSSVVKVKDFLVNAEFGLLDDRVDIMLDQVPEDPQWTGVVIDHHAHPEDHRYTLYWDYCPTGLIVYRIFGDQIPEKDKWKVAVACVGDGQPELIPPEIWTSYPVLTERRVYPRISYGSLELKSKVPIYFLISAPINSACRTGQRGAMLAYRILKTARSPLDLLENTALQRMREAVDDEVKRVVSEYKPVDIGKDIVFWGIDSEMWIESYLASWAAGNNRSTVVVVNVKTGKISVRGPLTGLIASLLPEYGISGHPGFMGGHLQEGQTPNDLYRDLHRCLDKLGGKGVEV